MTIKPIECRRANFDSLEVAWNDGVRHAIPSRLLRKNCPCATCREARGDLNHAKPLSNKSSLLKVIESTIEEETRLEEIWAVGNYAIGMKWGDGHSTGIYTYVLLRELGQNS